MCVCVPCVQKLMHPVQLCPVCHIRHRLVQTINEGRGTFYELSALSLSFQESRQPLVTRLRSDEIRTLLLQLNVCHQLCR